MTYTLDLVTPALYLAGLLCLMLASEAATTLGTWRGALKFGLSLLGVAAVSGFLALPVDWTFTAEDNLLFRAIRAGSIDDPWQPDGHVLPRGW